MSNTNALRSPIHFALTNACVALALALPATAQLQPGDVLDEVKISDLEGWMAGVLGLDDLGVGAPGDDDGGINRGAAWILALRANGTVKSQRKISQTAGSFGGTLADSDGFGTAIASLGDLDNDDRGDVMVGVPHADDGGPSSGETWTLFLNAGIWKDLGQPLGGTHGEPTFSALGAMVTGTPVSFRLDNVLENALARLVIGLSEISVPFKSGVMVPQTDYIIGATTVFNPGTGVGELEFNANWPGGLPDHFTSYFQYWTVDPAGPSGFSASNALSGTTP